MAEALTRKQVIQAVWNKFKAIIGNKDISGIGDGTVTGAIAGLNGKIFDIAIGYNQMIVGANQKSKISIDFSSKNYPITPVILVTPETDWADAIKISIDNTTSSGFDIIAHNSASSDTIITVHWTAIGRTN